MIIGKYLNRNYISVSPDTPLAKIIDIFQEKKIGIIPVIDENGLYAGVITPLQVIDLFMPEFVNWVDDLDFVQNMGAMELDREKVLKFKDVKAAEILVQNPHLLVQENCSLLGALAIMKKDHVTHLLVVKEGRLEGLVAQGDLLRAVLDFLKNTVRG